MGGHRGPVERKQGDGGSIFPAIPALVRLRHRAERKLRGRNLPVYFAAAYRPPLAGVEAQIGFDPRRAEMVLTYLLDLGLLDADAVRAPRRARIDELALVHGPEQLESIADPSTLARAFALSPEEVPAGELLHTLRLAVGGTIDAAREALLHRGPTMNLLGGFHHAGPARVGGFSVFNDVAIAARCARRDGLHGPIVILDLDAHPPDGTSAALEGVDDVHIGSISGARWDALPGVDETLLEPGPDGRLADDATYDAALAALLERLPRPALCFVHAGGDVLAGDRLGRLGLTLAGAAARDLRVASWLEDVPSVWVPSGGYHDDAWRLLATTASILALGRPEPPRVGYDPVRARIDAIARRIDLHPPGAEDEPLFDAADMAALFGRVPAGEALLLGFYNAEMLELALYRYGLLQYVRRLGYRDPRVEVQSQSTGDRFRLFAGDGEEREMLVEAVLQRLRHEDGDLLYVNWLTLRHPRGRFTDSRRQLPGQEVPGLGLAKEAGELLAQMARRLGLHGVAFRPAAVHVAYTARYEFRFADVARQARFEALLRDLGGLGLLRLSRAVADGQVRCNGARYAWEADLMVCWLDRARRPPSAEVDAIAATLHFGLVEAPKEG